MSIFSGVLTTMLRLFINLATEVSISFSYFLSMFYH